MHRVPQSSEKARPPLAVFCAATVVIFVLALAAAASVGFVPYYVDGTAPASAPVVPDESGITVVTELSQLAPDTLLLDGEGRIRISDLSGNTVHSVATALPMRISIPAIDLDLAIQNPSTTDVEKLDALLVNGPARYTDSARLGEPGNMIIFAHSSHLPIVHNQMYKAFNRIPELKAGDEIVMTADNGSQFRYLVNSVKKADVNKDVELSLAKNGTKLTLVTCDTLTGKSARYVLDATLISPTINQ